ncbi:MULTISPECIES: EVE domain-containing protein [Thermoprotei]|uniref:EVE domain-containing protein n=1 Tax=Thermoprotei TaxID=183924 RepID=UPI0031692565
MGYWLVMMSEENYRYTVENGVYGLPEGLSRLRDRIRPGDKLVIYIVKKNCKELCRSFVAVLEIVNGWRKSNMPNWPDEVREGRILYPWIVNVSAVAKGRIEFDNIKSEISRILGKTLENPSELRVYMLRELPSDFGEFVEGRLRSTLRAMEVSERAKYSHNDLVNMVKDIGEWLNFDVKLNYKIDNFKVDVAFFRKPRTGPLAVVEVHVGGDVFKDLSSLKHAYDKFGSKLIYVIARDEDKVVSLVNEAIEGAFHEIKDKIIILRTQELEEIHEALRKENTRRLIKELTTKI